VNNSLILAKGRSARLSRRRRWDFRPSRGKPAARARVRARLIGGKLTSKNGGNAGFFALLFPVLAQKSRSTAIPVESSHWARLANLTSETSSQLTPPSSEESGANPESLEAAIAPRWTGCASYDVSWPGNGEPPCEGPMVRIHPPPAVSQQTFGSSPDDARCSIMYHRVDDQPGAGRAGGRVKRCRDRVSRCQSRR